MAMTLNGLGKYYNKFLILIPIRKTFLDFQEFITLHINEDMKIITFHLVEDQKKVPSAQILIEIEVVEPHSEVDT
jgi:hypothetical protein